MTKPMTKAQLVAAVAERTETDKKTAQAAIDALSAVIADEVAQGGAVTLPDVGKIQCRERPERMVRNPATGEQMTKAADKALKMTFSKTLKERVNG
jgi:DNA-binding protein HU-beta